MMTVRGSTRVMALSVDDGFIFICVTQLAEVYLSDDCTKKYTCRGFICG